MAHELHDHSERSGQTALLIALGGSAVGLVLLGLIVLMVWYFIKIDLMNKFKEFKISAGIVDAGKLPVRDQRWIQILLEIAKESKTSKQKQVEAAEKKVFPADETELSENGDEGSGDAETR
ncbi:Oidioi.mRNA.OKI2018_I69.PAR.g9519.t1.cds [Oikopleura dioica]|uniref:Oidioi.mRNA.OKI2018_I69.PAR.g9519.t1.cds n=1 Tax=Oikopleura dioica TaxID=34765 RepID=A0ABN7RQ84_OIKDI|nr:Oidioi.mRNA.OKI2018_I69.PAR.g9519.t1.cds [Oikopleura dioica]